MSIILPILIFIIVLFFYLHIIFEYKINNSLEVLSSDLINKNKFEEICNLKQPTLFNYNNTNISNIFSKENLITKYKIFDLNVKNIKKEKKNIYKLNLEKTFKLLNNDTSQNYITENNTDFLKETNINTKIKELIIFLKPSLNIKNDIDIITGSLHSFTPLRYNISGRNFFYFPSGNIEIKLIPPKYTQYLNEIKDYEYLEFNSPINIWETQNKYLKNIKKIKQLNFIINPHKILYIPSYWWYSFKFLNTSNIISFKFNTAINILSNTKHHFLNLLQKQNIEYKKNPTLNIKKDIIQITPKKHKSVKLEDIKDKDVINKEVKRQSK